MQPLFPSFVYACRRARSRCTCAVAARIITSRRSIAEGRFPWATTKRSARPHPRRGACSASRGSGVRRVVVNVRLNPAATTTYAAAQRPPVESREPPREARRADLTQHLLGRRDFVTDLERRTRAVFVGETSAAAQTCTATPRRRPAGRGLDVNIATGTGRRASRQLRARDRAEGRRAAQLEGIPPGGDPVLAAALAYRNGRSTTPR